jgi:hypothetical protein
LKRVGNVNTLLILPDQIFNFDKDHAVLYFNVFYLNCVVGGASQKFFARTKIFFIRDFFSVKALDLQRSSASAKQRDVV